MKTSSRLILWALVAYLVPAGIFIYERGYNRDAMIWAVCLTLAAVIVETVLYFKTK